MRRRRIALLATAALAVTAGTIAAVGSPANAATGCAVTYTVTNSWSGGFQANLTVTNLGDPLTSWRLGFTFPDPTQRVGSGWNGDWSQTGSTVTVTNASWNGSLPTNGKVEPAFVGNGPASPKPSAFTLNGVACTGTPSNPSPSVTPSASQSSSQPPTSGPAPALRVSGNRIVTTAGRAYRLLGVNRASGEFACVQGKGMWDSGPVDQASVNAMKAWNVRAVRIPLNEDCWLGLSGSPSGSAYQQAVKDYVSLLVANGVNPILDLHWTHAQYSGNISACADVNATCQKPMPSMQYTPTFWTQVANAFKGNNAVVFDLFNEPYPDASNNWTDIPAAWRCLRDGGTCTGITYEVAGMQDLVDAVRATGATNIVLAAGLTWTNDLTQWLTYKPTDPTGNLVASWHSYNFNACVTEACWDSQIATVAAQVPVHAGEIGQDSCAHDYIDRLMTWLDAHSLGYTAWTWNPWGCTGGNVLITDYAGTPTVTYGQGFRTHLLTQNP